MAVIMLNEPAIPKPKIFAMYGRNFKPQIFTDITTPVKQSYSPNTGKYPVIKQIFKPLIHFTQVFDSGGPDETYNIH